MPIPGRATARGAPPRRPDEEIEGVHRDVARVNSVVVGTMFTPKKHTKGGRCERIRVVGTPDTPRLCL